MSRTRSAKDDHDDKIFLLYFFPLFEICLLAWVARLRKLHRRNLQGENYLHCIEQVKGFHGHKWNGYPCSRFVVNTTPQHCDHDGEIPGTSPLRCGWPSPKAVGSCLGLGVSSSVHFSPRATLVNSLWYLCRIAHGSAAWKLTLKYTDLNKVDSVQLRQESIADAVCGEGGRRSVPAVIFLQPSVHLSIYPALFSPYAPLPPLPFADGPRSAALRNGVMLPGVAAHAASSTGYFLFSPP